MHLPLVTCSKRALQVFSHDSFFKPKEIAPLRSKLPLKFSDGIKVVSKYLWEKDKEQCLLKKQGQAHQQGYKNPPPSLTSKTVKSFSFKEQKNKNLEATEILRCVGHIPGSSHLFLKGSSYHWVEGEAGGEERE